MMEQGRASTEKGDFVTNFASQESGQLAIPTIYGTIQTQLLGVTLVV